MARGLDLTGQIFNRLAVVKLAGYKQANKMWICVCVCGAETTVLGSNLRNGNVKSCGCLKRDAARIIRPIVAIADGRRGAKSSWNAMMTRCLNPNNKAYRTYGAKGITVCDRWKSFDQFYEDMGPRPMGLTLDRINPKGNYEPTNCRWANWETQAKNRKRKTHNFNGELLTAVEASLKYGIPINVLSARLSRRVSPEKLLLPVIPKPKKTIGSEPLIGRRDANEIKFP